MKRNITAIFVAIIVAFVTAAAMSGGSAFADSDGIPHPRNGYTVEVSSRCNPEATHSKTINFAGNEVWVVPSPPTGYTYTNIVFYDSNVIYDVQEAKVGSEYHIDELYGKDPRAVLCITYANSPVTTTTVQATTTTTPEATTTTVQVTTPPVPTPPTTPPTTAPVTAAPTTTVQTPEEGSEPTVPPVETTAPPTAPPTTPTTDCDDPAECVRLPNTGAGLTTAFIGLALIAGGAMILRLTRRPSAVR